MSDYLDKLREKGIYSTRTEDILCPKCSASRKKNTIKCLHVSFEDNRVWYRCNHCGDNGVIFYNEYSKASKKTYNRPEKPSVSLSQENMYKRFEERKISRATLDKFGVYMGKRKIEKDGEMIELKTDCLIFPYYKNGELVNNKYRWINKDKVRCFCQDKEMEQIPFGMDLITDFSRLVITEGETDCLSFAEIGIESISVPQGAEDDKQDWIENCYVWLQKFNKYIICVDNDAPYTEEQIKKDPKLKDKMLAGDKLRQTLVRRLGRDKCKIAYYKLPGSNEIEEYKDANEVLCKCPYGTDFLKVIIESAEYLPVENIYDFGDIQDGILDFKHNGFTKGKSTGWENLDRLITLHQGYLEIITGQPSSGKSVFHKNMLVNLTKQYEWKHCLFDKEANQYTSFATLYGMYTGKNFYYATDSEIETGINTLKYYFKIFPKNINWTIDEIILKAKECVKRYGINTLTIDPFNRVMCELSKEGMRLYVREFLNKCADFAHEYNVLTTIVAHPAKLYQGKKFPELRDISESIDWWTFAEYGLVAVREKDEDGVYSNDTIIRVEKIKDELLGNTAGGYAKLTKISTGFVDNETVKKESQQKGLF
jgi:twinkle protein